jgi:hypothetical protein
MQDVLQEVLSKLAHYGGIVRILSQFVVDTMDATHGNTTNISRTYQAFAVALSDYLKRLSKSMVEYESKLCKQG